MPMHADYIYNAHALAHAEHAMFSCVIQRWVALATFSRNAQVRSGIHDRAAEWPLLLVLAEKDRLAFDMSMCAAAGAIALENEERHAAFAMALHARLGALSHARNLVPDIVRQISCASVTIQTPADAYADFMHARLVAVPAGEHHQLQSFVYNGVPIHPARRGVCSDVRRMLRSEQEKQPAHVWPGRAGYFFCRRGWFSGVHPRYAPDHLGTQTSAAVISGFFEVIPHIFCDIWFPVCWPFDRCMHLLHITFQKPQCPSTTVDTT